MFYECLKQGIKLRNSVLISGKISDFCLNKQGQGMKGRPHLPTQCYIEYPPPPRASELVMNLIIQLYCSKMETKSGRHGAWKNTRKKKNTRKNGRARRRHACLPRARPFSPGLSPTTSKRLLRTGYGRNCMKIWLYELFRQLLRTFEITRHYQSRSSYWALNTLAIQET